VITKVLEQLPDNNWRLALVLARYGGLRLPSELERLTWTDIDWSGGRFTVRVPKKEHIDGHEARTIPIFPEIEPYLRQAFDDAEEGSVYILPPRFHADGYVRAGVLRAIERAGVARWPKLLVNLRGSRETELLLQWPAHVVLSWIGNTKEVAMAHYTMVTDADFERASQPQKAAQKAAQSGTGWSPQKPSRQTKTAIYLANARCTAVQAPPRGVEPRFSD
jgi:integrase